MGEILSLLAAAVVAVLVFSRLGLGSVLGYLAAGAVIGPSGLALVADPENMRHIGEFGVVFLLFLIGVEIKPRRLWVMRRQVFGMGGAQVLLTGAVLSGLVHGLLGTTIPTAVTVGFGLSLSSTAFGMQILSERRQMSSQIGRNSFSILLLQDLAVVPLLILLPFLTAGQVEWTWDSGLVLLRSGGVFVAAVVIGRYALGPLVREIAKSRSSDALVAMALLLVLGFAWIMEQIGLSMAMGAFIAGVLLAESEFRHQLEADIHPFRGLFLGLFFMSVGMALAPDSVLKNAGLVVGGTVGLLTVKLALTTIVCRIWKVPLPTALRTGFLLSQAGEFGFVLFALAGAQGLLSDALMPSLTAVIVLSMAATPLMVRLGDRLVQSLESRAGVIEDVAVEPSERPVLVAGFGRVGETVISMLTSAGIPCVAVDRDTDHVARGRRLGFKVYFGDASRLEVLRACGAEKARLLVVTIDSSQASEAVVRIVQQNFPEIPLHVRVRDWKEADTLSALGAVHAIPETIEASLRLGAAALEASGVSPEARRALFEELSADNFAKMRRQAKA